MCHNGPADEGDLPHDDEAPRQREGAGEPSPLIELLLLFIQLSVHVPLPQSHSRNTGVGRERSERDTKQQAKVATKQPTTILQISHSNPASPNVRTHMHTHTRAGRDSTSSSDGNRLNVTARTGSGGVFSVFKGSCRAQRAPPLGDIIECLRERIESMPFYPPASRVAKVIRKRPTTSFKKTTGK